ncbi:hypothetical protein EUTSA_v10011926mg [Eutrema salsugineum]|uniref:Uncharacterized protein n=1 Tax=Eutrema salsugineum TaxID=72664 RepID=V4MHX6_EUTSA|nr:hypothetical protein EUTSA_v10011926mg [Eutrema salsugineum]
MTCKQRYAALIDCNIQKPHISGIPVRLVGLGSAQEFQELKSGYLSVKMALIGQLLKLIDYLQRHRLT